MQPLTKELRFIGSNPTVNEWKFTLRLLLSTIYEMYSSGNQTYLPKGVTFAHASNENRVRK